MSIPQTKWQSETDETPFLSLLDLVFDGLFFFIFLSGHKQRVGSSRQVEDHRHRPFGWGAKKWWHKKTKNQAWMVINKVIKDKRQKKKNVWACMTFFFGCIRQESCAFPSGCILRKARKSKALASNRKEMPCSCYLSNQLYAGLAIM